MSATWCGSSDGCSAQGSGADRGLFRAILIFAISFGVAITQEQQDAALMLVGSALAVVSLLLTGVTMSKTTPIANPTLPEGTVVEVVTPEGQPNRTAVVV